ncbi:MAG: AAA family ATPase [Gammaproteobacteria bacterium]|nr:AAA family ATPase [Gammaproteobacteria bacterium]
MYYDFFGLSQAPFRITPDTQLFYSGGDRGDILAALVHAVSSGEGITKVVGEVGSGKTMLCRMLEVSLPGAVEIVYLVNPSIAPEHILHAIAFEMGLGAGSDENRYEVLKRLQEHLLAKHMNGRQVVVFIEEAQSMPLETLEEIRLLSNLETQKHKLLQVVLFGQPELDVKLAAPHVRQIKERITNGFYLSPLGPHEVRDYLDLRLHLAGYQGPDVFSSDAVRAFSRASRGVMRRLNILADKAMLAAYAQGERMVTARHVRLALFDSEFSSRGKTVVRSAGLLTHLADAANSCAAAIFHRSSINVRHVMRLTTDSVVAPVEAVPVCAQKTDETAKAHVDVTLERLEATLRWLSSADPDHYSVQLLQAEADASASVDRILSAGEVRKHLEQIYVYRSDIRGNPMLSVLYGSYDNYAAASEAVRDMESMLPGYQPYVRTVRRVMAEAGTSS